MRLESIDDLVKIVCKLGFTLDGDPCFTVYDKHTDSMTSAPACELCGRQVSDTNTLIAFWGHRTPASKDDLPQRSMTHRICADMVACQNRRKQRRIEAAESQRAHAERVLSVVNAVSIEELED